MKKKRVLLAGSTGYLGRYLAQQLKQSSCDSTLIVRGIRNSGFDPESYDLIEAEVTDRETLSG